MPPFFFQPITYDCVKTRILSLVNDKSHGLYFSPTCPTKLLKCSIDILAPVLSELFYISVSLGGYPTKLKLSKIVPVFKFDDETVTQIIIRLRVVSYFCSDTGDRTKRERAWKSPHARKGDTRRGERKFSLFPPLVAFSRVGWFSRALAFRSLDYPWGKMGDYS